MRLYAIYFNRSGSNRRYIIKKLVSAEPARPGPWGNRLSKTAKHRRSDMLNRESCWKAVLAKDTAQDGRFYFGVVTTGVYCRPSCPARKPLHKNVRFYETPEAAEREGLRAVPPLPAGGCARVRGKQRAIQQLCDYIRLHIDDGNALTLETSAARRG